MRHAKRTLVIVWAIALSLVVSVPMAHADTYTLDAQNSKIFFHVAATFHGFKGHCQPQNSQVQWDPKTGLFSPQSRMWIGVESLLSDNQERDGHIRQMFDDKQYPLIELQPLRMKQSSDQAYTLEAVIRMHGLEHAINVQMTCQQKASDVSMKGETLLMTDWFALKPPSMMGFVRVSPKVKVEFDILWHRV